MGQSGDVAAVEQSGQVESEPSWDVVISRGRSGETARIEFQDRGVDDDDVGKLTSADQWLETLILDAGAVTDQGVRVIAGLPALSHLRLRRSPITDQGLADLAECQTLRILNLPQSRATAAGIGKLASLSKLRSLRLGGETLSNPQQSTAVADAIASIKSLRSLHLIGVAIDDQGLQRIATLPKLQSLYLDDSAVSEAGWDWFFQHHADVHVHVNQHHLDRDPKQHDH